ncbi:hypothetical protein FO441_00990 [Salinicoccus cyprini]|uniref:Heparin-sulfate lyase N-terminal domain-containing protein n=1 Tax=Salinicoccus cyprini TaxID=2493691 RepID=A0A558AXA7_9STAP|nr:heparinase II/III family protein [Salinicoccus cyprini]TVT28887.1 hypothetical protein FO441_00990 [Salinicoccus cyprini]
MENLKEKDKLKKYISESRKNNKIANLALKNKYIFFGNFDEVIFSNKFNWNYKHLHSQNTYQVYMHTLNIVGFLTNSFYETSKIEYISKARDILKDWIDSEENTYDSTKNASWKDHSVASRVKNIIFYQLLAPDNLKLEKSTIEIQLKLHGDYLSDREHYSENNHGMMSDEALLLISNFIESPELSARFKEISVLRMERIIYKLFSSKGMNLENSPEYHKLTQILSRKFIKLTEIMGIEFDQKCKDIIANSLKIDSLIIKPNNTYPLIGDTGLRTLHIKKSYDNFIDYQAGLAIINTLNKEQEINSSWLSFKAGYVSKSHKQLDDLSINYYHQGEDILVDSGKYNYDRKDPMKQYVRSPIAHSTFLSKEKIYALTNPLDDIDYLRLVFIKETPAFVHMAAINHLYENMNVWRDIIYFESKGFIVIDRYLTDTARLVAQNFNLHEELTVKKGEGNEYKISTPNNVKLVLKEHTPRTVNRYYGHSHKERGFISRKFGQFIETQQIEFIKKSYKNQFITTLHEEKAIHFANLELVDEVLSIEVNGEKHTVYLQAQNLV